MRRLSPRGMLVLGFILVLLGFLLPLGIVVGVLPSTFFLNFFSWAASVSGLFLGLIGAAMMFRGRKE